MGKILKVAKRLKTFTLEDIVMFCEIDATIAKGFLQESENIKPVGNKFEYVESVKTEEKFKIVDKNIECQNSDITVVEACTDFLNIWQSKVVKLNTIKAYRAFINAHIIPYFKNFKLKDMTISDIENFRKTMQNIPISERRIKNILALLNQIIRYFQDEGYIDKTCVYEVKRIADIPKREIQILTSEQLAQLFKITNKKYPYLTLIIQKLITLKLPLNAILTGDEQEKERIKQKIRKDFYKIKQEMGLENYKLDDLRFCNKIDN